MEFKQHSNLRRRVFMVGFIAFVLSASALAIDIFTKPEVIVKNGTACVLRCTFKSNEVVSSYITADWSFQSNQPHNQFFKAPYTIFYFFDGKVVVSSEFEDRVQFIGDINKKDVSIQINPVQFGDNGTYTCEVKNPPDISSTSARTELRVVLRAPVPALAINIFTEPEVIVENGAACVLRCTFKSNEVVSSYTTATWYFQSNQPDNQFFKAPYMKSGRVIRV
ncbi:myelin protein zero-like protein 1 isoform X2 [Corythoichthys intestinalis]|uniref:myelin protein zero-like protein 1 isoform X2 n=1 Tax=Corythoichthys intestinalis TaxID=161448 RepID=UPI0025A5CF4A|nr:myelin protein zero-like protein 1 isoform X2 [Corythoichthys intestinalis]